MSVKKSQKDAKRKKRKSQSTSIPFARKFYGLNRDEPEKGGPWFGYKDSFSAQQHSDNNPTILCMVNEINMENFSYFQDKFPDRFELGEWFVSGGSCATLTIAGPMKSLSEAFDYSKNNFNANYFLFGGW